MKISGSLFLLIILASFASAQERDTLHSTDTHALKNIVFPGSTNSLADPTLLPPLRISDVEINRDFPSSSFGMALLSKPSVTEEPVDVSWHMTLSQKNRDPLETLRMILGSVEKGGAAYLAYRHLSKFGFLK